MTPARQAIRAANVKGIADRRIMGRSSHATHEFQETIMSKGQHGNREAKKPKKIPIPASPLVAPDMAAGRSPNPAGAKKK